MKNNEVLVQQNEVATPTETTLVLLDGRVVTVKIGESFQLYNSDGESMRMHFDILNERSTFHQALFKVICGTLSTHSLKYNVTITVALRAYRPNCEDTASLHPLYYSSATQNQRSAP